MRLRLWRLAAASAVLLATAAHADIFLYRDRFGVLHLTNAPAERGHKVMNERKDEAIAPSPKVLKVGGGNPFARRGTYSMAAARTFVESAGVYDGIIRQIADRYDLEYALMKAVIKTESNFDPRAISPKGALGLMQLMPGTASMHGVQNAMLPAQNIEGGARHLRMLLDRYAGNLPLTLAAYNAGEGRVENAGGIPDIPETRDYVVRVLRHRLRYLGEGAGVQQVRR